MRANIIGIILIIFYLTDLPLMITSLSVIKWKKLVLGNFILFLLMISLDSICFLIIIFLFIQIFQSKRFFVICFLLSILNASICLGEFVTILISIDKVNYPCKPDINSKNGQDSSSYYYVYYYRRLSSDFDCKDLPEDYYTGIFSIKESTISYVTIIYSFFALIIQSVFLYKLIYNGDSFSFYFPSICDYCCLGKKRKRKKTS